MPAAIKPEKNQDWLGAPTSMDCQSLIQNLSKASLGNRAHNTRRRVVSRLFSILHP